MAFIRSIFMGAAVASALIAAPAHAVISLNFENIAPAYPNNNDTFIQNYYNGGTSSSGTSGTNYGIAFSDNALALCLNTIGGTCSNSSRGGLGDPSSQRGALFFLSGSQTYLNYAAGFDTGFSFFYSAANQGGSVFVYDGLNGTGNVLGQLDLSINGGSCPGYNAGFCPFSAAGVNFSGTAKSIGFAGVANQIAFDDVTFGSATPGNPSSAVPEPATWAMMIAGFGMVGVAFRRKRHEKLTLRYS